jgi:hypothetical protein
MGQWDDRTNLRTLAPSNPRTLIYFNLLYAIRSARNDPSHSSLPTTAAIAVPVNDGVRGPRAISVAAIVFGSMVTTA